MPENMKIATNGSIPTETRPHYQILDALRGVAALLVIWFHIFEGYATSPIDQKFNHGYLAVDFFFILSGFVMGYAYDNRLRTKEMSTGEFFKRRLIRLHPMVIAGAIFGLVSFCIQGGVQWSGAKVEISAMMFALFFAMFLIPVLPGTSLDVRGHNEIFPLNGPTWSLFFEYIANIVYILFLHRLPTKFLTILTVTTGIGLAAFSVSNLSGWGHLGVGWSFTEYNLPGGLLRVMFSYSAGLLMSRVFTPANVKGAFWICSAVLCGLFIMPHLGIEGSENTYWKNGVYDSVCVIFIFPILVWIGASAKSSGVAMTKFCKTLGDISYPLYVIHYPVMYLFYSWLWKSEPHKPFADTWHVTLAVFFGNILLAFLVMKLYDEPVRKFLASKFLKKQAKS